MTRYRDFDKFFQEAAAEPVTLTYQGETHHLRSSLPVATVLMISKLEKMESNETVTDQVVVQMFQQVFGQDLYRKWLKGGMTVTEMVELLRWALVAYGMASDPKPTAEQK